ncbi:MAG: O-antigen ligase family protein [Methyloligellaceae bacterium]
MLSRLLPTKLIVLIFGIFVALAAVPLGGNIALAWGLNGVITAFMLMWFAVDARLAGGTLPVPVRTVSLPLIAYMLVCLAVFLQSSSYLPGMLSHPLWSETATALGKAVPATISVNPSATLIGLLRLLTYGGVFWLALQFGRDYNQADFLLKIIAIAVLANALYAITLWSSGSQTILGFDKWVGKEEVTGTFVNRNHFASYIGIGCVIWLLFVLRSVEGLIVRLRGVRLKYYTEIIIGEFFIRKGLYLCGLLILVGVLLLSRSRAGFLCAFAGMFTLMVLRCASWSRYFKSDRSETPSSFINFSVGFCVMIIACSGLYYLFQKSGGSRLLSRLSSENAIDYERVGVFGKAIQAIGDAPWFGSGFGTFADIFPLYRDSILSAYGRWNQAHNTYLENLMELGVPVAVLLFLTVGWCVYRCLQGALLRKKSQSFSQTGFSVSVIVLLHSLIDFPLQISGITITYVTLLGLGVSQSWSSRSL